MNLQRNDKYDEPIEEENSACLVILGVGAWGCRLLNEFTQNENITTWHTQAAMDSNAENLESSGATIKIHLDADMLNATGQGLLIETNLSEVVGNLRQLLKKADLIYVLLDTADENLEAFMCFLDVLLSRSVIRRHALTIALLSNTKPDGAEVYSDIEDVIKIWRTDTSIDLSKTERCRHASRIASFIEPDALFQAYVSTHTDIIRSISDPRILAGLVRIDFAEIGSIFSNRSELFLQPAQVRSPTRHIRRQT